MSIFLLHEADLRTPLGWLLATVFHQIFLVLVLTVLEMALARLLIELPVAPFALDAIVSNFVQSRHLLSWSEIAFWRGSVVTTLGHHGLPELKRLNLPLWHLLLVDGLVVRCMRIGVSLRASLGPSFLESERFRKLVHCRLFRSIDLSLFLYIEYLTFLVLLLGTDALMLFDGVGVELAATITARHPVIRFLNVLGVGWSTDLLWWTRVIFLFVLITILLCLWELLWLRFHVHGAWLTFRRSMLHSGLCILIERICFSSTRHLIHALL